MAKLGGGCEPRSDPIRGGSGGEATAIEPRTACRPEPRMEVEADARHAAIEHAAADLGFERARAERLQAEAEARDQADAERRRGASWRVCEQH